MKHKSWHNSEILGTHRVLWKSFKYQFVLGRHWDWNTWFGATRNCIDNCATDFSKVSNDTGELINRDNVNYCIQFLQDSYNISKSVQDNKMETNDEYDRLEEVPMPFLSDQVNVVSVLRKFLTELTIATHSFYIAYNVYNRLPDGRSFNLCKRQN